MANERKYKFAVHLQLTLEQSLKKLIQSNYPNLNTFFREASLLKLEKDGIEVKKIKV